MKNKELRNLIQKARHLKDVLNPPVLLPSGTKAEIIERWGSIANAARAVDLDCRLVYRQLTAGRAPTRFSPHYQFILNNDLQSIAEEQQSNDSKDN